jgi:hypothetical protein
MHLEVPKMHAEFQVKLDDTVELGEKYATNAMECLMGTRDGTIYIYDPVLVTKASVLSYNDVNLPFHKEKRPEIVRWVEPILHNPTGVR